jgi:iron complex transport system ATP-binding protein
MTVLVQGRALAVGYRSAVSRAAGPRTPGGRAHAGRERELRLLDGADFEVRAGELVCLLGPNGSGKSTLLRTLAGMQPPLAGTVELLGEDVATRSPEWLARHLSIVLTEPIDAGALTARELVGLGRYPFTDWLGRLTARDHERIEAAIAAVGALAIAEREVKSLSDGERQRVLIARALAQEPKLVILDEPTAYLDLPRRIETLGLLRRLVRENGIAVLLSTHHLDLALGHADRVWLLPTGGPLTIGAPEDVALSGALERTFHSDRLVFDPNDGTFALREEPADAAVAVEGDGLARRWVERALRRDGLAPVEGGEERPGSSAQVGERAAGLPVIARVRVEAARYRLEVGGERVDCASIEALLWELEARRPRGVRPATS